MDNQRENNQKKEDKEQVSKHGVSTNIEHQPFEKDANHTDQQEGNMNNGELGANLSSEDDEKQ